VFVSVLTYHREIDREGPLFLSHKAFVQEHIAASRLLCSGPRTGAPGGVIVAYGDDEAQVRELLEQDPFVIDGVATYELVGFKVGLADPASSLAAPGAG
jgi:uncharacterized protein YciI